MADAGQLPSRAARRNPALLAVIVSLAAHGAVGWWAAERPERTKTEREAPRPKTVSFRQVTAPGVEVRPTPPTVPEIVAVKPIEVEPIEAVPPAPVELQSIQPIELPEPISTEPVKTEPAKRPEVEPRSASKAGAKKKKTKARKKKKRRPGRTLISNRKGAPATSAPSGSGGAVELGEWSPGAPAPSPSDVERGGDEDGSAGGDVDRSGGAGPSAPSPATGTVPAPPKKPVKLVPPKPLSRPKGRYPPGVARSSAGPVRVVLTLKVDTKGRVTGATVVRGAGGALNAAATKLARSIRFEPARRGDKAVAMSIPWTVIYE